MNNKIELENMITMIGCGRNKFMEIVKSAIGKVSLSSGSYYSDFSILDDKGTIAKYDCKGILIYNRLAV